MKNNKTIFKKVIVTIIILAVLSFLYVLTLKSGYKMNQMIGSQETVMNQAETITAIFPSDTIKIVAGERNARTYIWDDQQCTRTITLHNRSSRWYGSFGIYFPGPDFLSTNCNKISGIHLDEGQQHFSNVAEVQQWLKGKLNWSGVLPPSRPSIIPTNTLYTSDGLVVIFKKYVPTSEQIVDTISRHHYDPTNHGTVTFQVWQIYIDGSKPTNLEGAQNTKVVKN